MRFFEATLAAQPGMRGMRAIIFTKCQFSRNTQRRWLPISTTARCGDDRYRSRWTFLSSAARHRRRNAGNIKASLVRTDMEHDALPVPTRDKMFHRYVIELAAKLLQVQRNLSVRKRVRRRLRWRCCFRRSRDSFPRFRFNFALFSRRSSDLAKSLHRWDDPRFLFCEFIIICFSREFLTSSIASLSRESRYLGI